jgi:hypothetical protein
MCLNFVVTVLKELGLQAPARKESAHIELAHLELHLNGPVAKKHVTNTPISGPYSTTFA